MQYDELAKEIIEAVGGEENVKSVTNCATRLRFVLKEKSKVDKASLDSNKGVLGVLDAQGTYQVLIGTHVPDVYKSIISTTNLKEEEAVVENDEPEKKAKLLDRFLAVVSAIFTPYIPVLATAGIIKGVVAILVNTGVLAADSNTFAILSAAGNSLIYFFPILLAFTGAKKFGANPYVGAAIGAALMEPNITAIAVAGNSLSFVGIPFPAMGFANTVIPIIFAMFVFSYLEKFLKRYLPKPMQFIFVPFLSLVIMVPLTMIVLGPLGNLFSNGVAALYQLLLNGNKILFCAVFGVGFIFIIMFGLHWIVLPLQLGYLAQFGYEYSLASGGLGNYSLLGVTLAVWIFSKNRELKEVAASAAFINFLSGITEPGLYGVCIKNKKFFGALIIGGLVGGITCGALDVYLTNFAFTGLLAFPAFLGTPRIVGYCICIAVTIVSAFISTFFLIQLEKKKI